MGTRGNPAHSSLNPSDVRSFWGSSPALRDPSLPPVIPPSPSYFPLLLGLERPLTAHPAQPLSGSHLGISAPFSFIPPTQQIPRETASETWALAGQRLG